MTDPTNIEGAFRPATREGARAFVTTPFARVARTHGIGAMADAMVAASLAGSLFFSTPSGEARGPVLQYLVITMLPFSVLSPLIGPLIDRMKGGHRLMVIASNIARALACWFMAISVNSGDFTFFLYALVLLVFQKAYAVARSALVPTVVRSEDELVQANSKLALISGIASVVGVVPAALLIKLFGAQWSLRLAMIVYIAGAFMAFKITPVRVAQEAADPTEKIELRGATIFLAGSAMGIIRGSVGFMMFLIAFALSDHGKVTVAMGLVGASLAAFQQVGNLLAPRIREHTDEENLLTGVLIGIVACGVVSLFLSPILGGIVIGGAVGFAASAGKLAFDSILQRDAPDANRGRAFAKFETKFQIFWVAGALIPVAFEMSAFTGYLLLLFAAVFALAAYLMGRMSYAHQTGAKTTITTARAAALDARIDGVSTELKGRLAAMPRAAFRRMRTGRDGGDYDGEYDDEYYDDEYYDEYDEYYEDEPRGGRHHHDAGQRSGRGSQQGGHGSYDDYDESWDPAQAPVSDHGDGQVFDQFAAEDRYGNDPTRWEQPQWVDSNPVEDTSPASSSPVAWVPDDVDEYPWEEPQPRRRRRRDYLDDLDEHAEHPYPWSPDDPTRPG